MRSFWVKIIFAVLCLSVLSVACTAGRWFKRSTVVRREVVKQSVLVFPFDIAPEVNMSALTAKAVAGAAREKLQQTGKYNVFLFSERLAPIQRAIEVDKVFASNKQLEPPYSDDKKRLMLIAGVTAADCALSGVIESYNYDAASKTVSILLSAEMIEVKTGRTLGVYTATGKATASAQIADENELKGVALADAVAKLGLDSKDKD